MWTTGHFLFLSTDFWLSGDEVGVLMSSWSWNWKERKCIHRWNKCTFHGGAWWLGAKGICFRTPPFPLEDARWFRGLACSQRFWNRWAPCMCRVSQLQLVGFYSHDHIMILTNCHFSLDVLFLYVSHGYGDLPSRSHTHTKNQNQDGAEIFQLQFNKYLSPVETGIHILVIIHLGFFF